MNYVIIHKAQVHVKPFQRRGKLVSSYTRIDPREKHERVSEKTAHNFVDEVKNLAKERNFDIQVVEVEDYGDKTHMEFFLWEKGAEQVMMKRYKEKTPGLMGRLELSYYHDGNKGYVSAVFLKPEFQSGGLGTDMIKKFIDNGVKHGYKRFEMLANGDVGTYAWPVQGFNWASKSDQFGISRDFVKYLEKEHHYIADQKYFPNAWDIATFKIDDEKVGKDWITHEGRTFYEAYLEVGTPAWEIYKHYHELRSKKKETK
jgi:GNAT superfamily N-acetyltransferase